MSRKIFNSNGVAANPSATIGAATTPLGLKTGCDGAVISELFAAYCQPSGTQP